MKTPALTVITVSFNCQSTIGDTIRSIQAQRDADYSHLVIDGASTDGTVDVVKQHPDIQLVSERDHGIYDAMNKGIRLASGTIIGFLNGDDMYENDTVFSTVIAAFAADPQLEIVYGDLVYVSATNPDKIVRTWKTADYYPQFFEDGLVPPHPSFFVKRQALLDTDGFDLSFKIAADYELMFRLLKIEQRPSRHMTSTFTKMRLGGVSNRSVKNIKLGNHEVMRTWSKHQIAIPLKFWVKRYWKKVRQFL